MPALTAYASNKLLDAIWRGQQLIVPSVWYVALVTTEGPSNDLAGVEVNGGSYSRVGVASSLATWAGTQGDGSTGVSIGASGRTSNNASIVFPNPTANWGQIVGYELWDSLTFGNRWIYDVLPIPMYVSIGDPVPEFPPGTFPVTFN